MDIREKIEELWEKITADDGILERFEEEPIKTVENLLGIDLPDEKLRELVAALMAKLKMENIDDKLDGLADKLDDKLDGLADKLDDKLDILKGKVDADAIDDKLDDLTDKLEGKLGGLFGKKN